MALDFNCLFGRSQVLLVEGVYLQETDIGVCKAPAQPICDSSSREQLVHLSMKLLSSFYF